MWLTLDQIQCLKTVEETGSLSGAADRMNKAKSAVSYSITRLEEQLDFRVIEKKNNRMKLTRKGAEFLQKADKLLLEADQLKFFAEQLRSGVELQLSMSCSELYPLKEFNKVLSAAQKKFPQTQITFQREILSGESFLRRGQVDIAIYEDRNPPVDFESKKISEIDLRLVISSRHPFAELHPADQSLETLLNFPQIVQRSTIPDTKMRGVQNNAIKWFVSDTYTKKQIILDGLGWGRLPDHEVDREIERGRLTHLKTLGLDDNVSMFICREASKSFGKVSQFFWDQF